MPRAIVTSTRAFTKVDQTVLLDDAGADCCCEDECFVVAERCACETPDAPFNAFVPCQEVFDHPNWPGLIVFRCEGACYTIEPDSEIVTECFEPCCDLIPEFECCSTDEAPECEDPCCTDCFKCADCCYGDRDWLQVRIRSSGFSNCSKKYRPGAGQPAICECCTEADQCLTTFVRYEYAGLAPPFLCDFYGCGDNVCIAFQRNEAKFPFGYDPQAADCDLSDSEGCYDPEGYSCPECGDSWPQVMIRCCLGGDWRPVWYGALGGIGGPGQCNCCAPCCAKFRQIAKPCPPCGCLAVNTPCDFINPVDDCVSARSTPLNCQGEMASTCCLIYPRPQTPLPPGGTPDPETCCKNGGAEYKKRVEFCVTRVSCCTSIDTGACIKRVRVPEGEPEECEDSGYRCGAQEGEDPDIGDGNPLDRFPNIGSEDCIIGSGLENEDPGFPGPEPGL